MTGRAIALTLTRLGADVRHAIRGLRNTPGDAIVACSTLALALTGVLGATGLYDALVLRVLPVVRVPEQLVSASLVGPNGRSASMTLAAVDQFAKESQTFAAFSGFSIGGAFRVDLGSGLTTLQPATLVAPGCLELLGVTPLIGRSFPSRLTGSDPSVILDNGFWHRAFHADASVVGRSILVDGTRLTIIGVAPPGFTGLGVELDADLILPLNYDPAVSGNPARPPRVNFALGRLRQGATLEMARAEIATRWPAIRDATMPPTSSAAQIAAARALRVDVESFATGYSVLRDHYQTPLRVLSTITIALLVIAALSVGGLLLARTLAREQEFATRRALGAPRGQIAQQIAVEASVYAAIAGGMAIPLAWWGRVALRDFIWTGIVPATLNLAPTWRDAVLTVVISSLIVASMVATCRLSLGASRPMSALTFRSVVSQRHRWASRLAIAQVAVSLTSLFSAGLLVRSAAQLGRVPLGFSGDRVFEARLLPVTNGYADMNASAYYADLASRLRALPGVVDVAYSHVFPSPLIVPDTVVDAGAPAGEVGHPIALETVSPGFFGVVGASLLFGRDFTDADTPTSPAVAVVSRALAASLFPGGAVGRHIRIGHDPTRQNVAVIGVTGDLRLGNVRDNPPPAVYRPLAQEPTVVKQPIVLLKTAGPPQVIAGPLRQTLASLHREYLVQPLSLTSQIATTTTEERTLSLVATIMGALVLLLTLVGLYGLLSQQVRRRAPELSVRMALGASPAAVRRLIVLQALRLVGIGTLLGFPLALIGARVTRAVLFDVSPSDPATLALVASLFFTVAILGSLGPAWRASSLDPLRVFRV